MKNAGNENKFFKAIPPNPAANTILNEGTFHFPFEMRMKKWRNLFYYSTRELVSCSND